MPLFDAYTGPYKFKHRYWTGTLLLIRVAFLLIFSLNTSNNPAVVLLTITAISFTLLVYLSYVQVYKNWLHNFLEMSSLFNLALLSMVTFYQMATDGDISLSTNLSTGMAFCTLSVIALYQSFKRLISLRKVKYFWIKFNSKLRFSKRDRRISEVQNEGTIDNTYKGFTHTSIELCEQLLVN